MTANWQPGTYYGPGSEVRYDGAKYRIIQPHTSQGDWTPPVTPALWGRMQDDGGDNKQQQSYQAPPQQQYQTPQPQYQPPQSHGAGGYPADQKVEPTEEERKTNWWDLDDERKKQLSIGGGLLAGAAALGAGYFAFKHHEKSEEEKQAYTWGLTNWLHDAQRRTQEFQQNGARGPATWILNQGKNIPTNAIVVGQEHDWTLYICRAFYEGAIVPGKASNVFKKGAVIGHGHDEIHLDTYEILVGDMNGLRWVDATGRLNVNSLGARPVEGGREGDGTPLFVVRAMHKGCYHPGKASEKLKGAFIPYDDSEKEVDDYQVLCYA